MSFSVPTFNLFCNIFTGPWPAAVARLTDVPCNLAMGRRVNSYSAAFQTQTLGLSAPALLLPARTDIRDNACLSGYDIVECPAGTGRFYASICVDDVGRGFDNEYRMATLAKIADCNDPLLFPGAVWPTPIP